jgi:hypothetical protein
VAINLVLFLRDRILGHDEWRKIHVGLLSGGGPGRVSWKVGDGLEGREGDRGQREFGCAPWNGSRRTEAKRTGGRTTRHAIDCLWVGSPGPRGGNGLSFKICDSHGEGEKEEVREKDEQKQAW